MAARLDRVHLGVGAAVLLVPALPQHLAVARDDRAHDGVGLDGAGAVARELDRPREVDAVGVGEVAISQLRITPCARPAGSVSSPQRPPCRR